MQPRFRSLVWRELPPCARRFYLAWSRRFFHAELLIGRLYLSWTKSPTWNFVAVAGTIGIVLTILLFLSPLGFELEGSPRKLTQQPRPGWELDSRLVAIRSPKAPAYPVELLFEHDRSRSPAIVVDAPRRRRTRTEPDDPPILPLFAAEPAVRTRPPREPDLDWGADPKPKPPKLGWDVEIVTSRRRPRREPVAADVTWTGKSVTPKTSDPFEITGDDWQPFDAARLARHERRQADDFLDEEAVAASLDVRAAGEPWQPLAAPESAPSAVDVQLELTWDHASPRRNRAPRLHLRNLGTEAIAQIDVIAGPLPAVDWSLPADFTAQSLSQLSPGRDDAVAVPQRGGRRSGSEIISVLVTTFIGGTTRVSAAAAERPRSQPVLPQLPIAQPDPEPSPRRIRASEPDRPHLTMSVGQPGRLPLEKMVSVPIRVVNDGNVTLYEVMIVADVPASLEHQFGRKVHYRLGKMQAGEQKRATLLLTPLETGSSTVPLEVTDGKRLARDSGNIGIEVAAEELAARPQERSKSRRSREVDAESPADSRRRTRNPGESGFGEPPAATSEPPAASDFGAPPELDAPRRRDHAEF